MLSPIIQVRFIKNDLERIAFTLENISHRININTKKTNTRMITKKKFFSFFACFAIELDFKKNIP